MIPVYNEGVILPVIGIKVEVDDNRVVVVSRWYELTSKYIAVLLIGSA